MSLTRAPRVTVLMSVYNAARYLEKAVQSILDQTFGDFEFLIINDGSRDGSREILEGFRDPRIRLIHTENRGVAAAVERGITESRAPYVARMDADDISLPDRLERQVAYLDQHPAIGVVTGDHVEIDADDVPIRTCRRCDRPLVIGWKLLWENVIWQSAVMIRRDVMQAAGLNYDPQSIVEDYDLWTRLLFHTRFGHIPRVLVQYRRIASGITGTRDRRQLEATSRIQQRTLSTLLGHALDPCVGESMALLSQQTIIRPAAARDVLDADSLIRLGRAARRAFDERFVPSPPEGADIDSDLAARYLDWGFFLSRIPERSGDATGVLLREALRLHPGIVFHRRLGRNLLAGWVGSERCSRWASRFRSRWSRAARQGTSVGG